MLQYLLNATGIWLLSLALFDALLRKESYHAYNRLYLLATFLLGLLVPLCRWPATTYSYEVVVLQRSVVRAVHAKEVLAIHSLPQHVQGISLLTFIYLAGAGIALCILLLDISKLFTFFGYTNKTRQGNWTIVETNKGNAPFSFLYTLFVNSRQQYSDNEWQMILRHEERHASLVHLADLAFILLARILLWFPPLVYVYYRRLSLVHEYQADAVAENQVKAYGTFLINQSMLAAAPHSAHSFNRSPIKNRIFMLTRKSTSSAKRKMLLLPPLTAICLLCFSGNGFARPFKQKGNSIVTSGNVVTISGEQKDTMIIVDPMTGAEATHIKVIPAHPVKVNGKEIQDMEPEETGLFPEVMTNANEKYFFYLSEGLRPLLEKLDDGKYMIGAGNVSINEKGELAYYELRSITKAEGAPALNVDLTIDDELKEKINKKTTELLADCPKFGVYKTEGKPMPYILGNFFVTVKYHHLHAM